MVICCRCHETIYFLVRLCSWRHNGLSDATPANSNFPNISCHWYLFPHINGIRLLDIYSSGHHCRKTKHLMKNHDNLIDGGGKYGQFRFTKACNKWGKSIKALWIIMPWYIRMCINAHSSLHQWSRSPQIPAENRFLRYWTWKFIHYLSWLFLDCPRTKWCVLASYQHILVLKILGHFHRVPF